MGARRLRFGWRYPRSQALERRCIPRTCKEATPPCRCGLHGFKGPSRPEDRRCVSIRARRSLIHGKANSDRIMGRPAGNGAVPTPKRTMSPDKGTGGITAAKLQGLAIRYGCKGASPLHPRQGSRTLGTREKSLTAAPRTKEPMALDVDMSAAPSDAGRAHPRPWLRAMGRAAAVAADTNGTDHCLGPLV